MEPPLHQARPSNNLILCSHQRNATQNLRHPSHLHRPLVLSPVPEDRAAPARWNAASFLAGKERGRQKGCSQLPPPLLPALFSSEICATSPAALCSDTAQPQDQVFGAQGLKFFLYNVNQEHFHHWPKALHQGACKTKSFSLAAVDTFSLKANYFEIYSFLLKLEKKKSL